MTKYGGINSKLALQLAYKEENKDSNDSEEMVGSDMGSVQQSEEDEQTLTGVYIKAFCSGVNEFLMVYKQHLLAIEHEFIKDRSLTIASLHLRLAIYSQMFPALTALITEIVDKELIGGQLLDALHQSCTTGNPVIKNMFTRILFVCHKVFFHQVNAWIVHGQLVDISQEFFIHKLQQSKDKGPGVLSETKDDAKSELNKSAISSPNVNLFSSILMSAENFGDDD